MFRNMGLKKGEKNETNKDIQKYIHIYIDCTSWTGPFSSNIEKWNAYSDKFGTKWIKNYYFKSHGQNVREKLP